MGIGIIALSLWLLFGIKFSINQIEFVPVIIGYTFMTWGISVVLKKYKNKNMEYALILSILLIILEMFHHIFIIIISCVISCIQLFFLLKGIIEIADDYPQIQFMKQKFKNYFIFFVIINILTIDVSIFHITVHYITIILVVIYAFMTIPMVYRLTKINRFMYDQNEPTIIHNPIKRKKRNKFIAIIIMIICIISFSMINTIIPMINQNQSITNEVILKGESKNIKVEYVAIEYEAYQENLFDLIKDIDILHPQLYIKDELFENIENIDYKIIISNGGAYSQDSLKPVIHNQSNRIVYHGYQNIQLEDIDHNEFDYGFFGNVEINNQTIINLKNQSHQMTMYFYITDHNHNEIEEIVQLYPIVLKEYGYQDQQIKIDHLLTDGKVFFTFPKISIQKSYFPHDKQYNRLIIKYNDNIQFDDTIDYNSLENHYIYIKRELMYQMIPHNDVKMTIELYNNDILVDSQIFTLEELQ